MFHLTGKYMLTSGVVYTKYFLSCMVFFILIKHISLLRLWHRDQLCPVAFIYSVVLSFQFLLSSFCLLWECIHGSMNMTNLSASPVRSTSPSVEQSVTMTTIEKIGCLILRAPSIRSSLRTVLGQVGCDFGASKGTSLQLLIMGIGLKSKLRLPQAQSCKLSKFVKPIWPILCFFPFSCHLTIAFMPKTSTQREQFNDRLNCI